MAREKTKTDPIGVRFDKNLLEWLILTSVVDSPQYALNLYEKSYLELAALKTNPPEVKESVGDKKETYYDGGKDKSYLGDECGQTVADNSEIIAKYESEIATLQPGTFGNQRKKFLLQKIKELKSNH